jgi:hypothetical protein
MPRALSKDKIRKITAAEAMRRIDKAQRRENSTPPRPYTPDLVPRKRKNAIQRSKR